MNILFLNSIGRDKFGGGEKWMVKASAGLAGRGHNVVLASRKDSRILKAAENAGVQTKIIEIHADFSPTTTWQISQYLKENHVQILICNLNKDVRVAGLAARLVGHTVVLARHGLLLCGNKWRHKQTLTKLADGIITNSKTIKEAYKGYGWFDEDFVRVIYNGIEPKSGIEPYDFSADFPQKRVVFSAGRLAEQKGFPDFISAAEILLKKHKDVAFVIMGEGKLKDELQALINQKEIAEYCRIWDFQPNIDPYLLGCDLFVLASLFEGMPNVVMESMAVGRAVVATDVNGARELMGEEESGLIVPPSNPEALAKAIDVLLSDPVKRQAFGQSGLRRVRETFTIDKMVTELEALFTQRLEEKNSVVL
jgi:glycosyltransferase involved in cell wall biosynthesis